VLLHNVYIKVDLLNSSVRAVRAPKGFFTRMDHVMFLEFGLVSTHKFANRT